MQEILIRPELLELVREGKKTTTCRFGKREYALERTILKSNVDEDDFTIINLIGMHFIEAKEITDEIALSDGFINKSNLLSVLKDIYGEIKDTDIISIVYFELSE